MIVETAVAVTLLCTSAKRQRPEVDVSCITNSGSAGIHLVRVASGRTLEAKMVDDIEEMSGVVDVTVKRTGDVFDVFVVMENMDFAPFSAVVQKELDLDAKFPDYTFNFDLLPLTAITEESTLRSNAA